MNTKNLIEYNSPIIVDVGSDSVKFTQTASNSLALSKKNKKDVTKKNKKELNSSDESDESDIVNNTNTNVVNSNSIFDMNLIDSFPTMIGLVPLDSPQSIAQLKKIFEKDTEYIMSHIEEIDNLKDEFISYEYKLHNIPPSKPDNKFNHELTYGGIIDKYDKWKNILDRIGESKYGKNNFINNQYVDTPLILTQHGLPFGDLKPQIKKIYEHAFEDYGAPYVLICSNAMVNIFSQNLTSGIVVDIGETGTQITPVINGFTQYHKSSFSSSLSGRNVTSLLDIYGKLNPKTNSSDNNLNELININYKSYLNTKYFKETNKNFRCFNILEEAGNNSTFENEGSIYDTFHVSTFSQLFSFPQLYKWIFHTTKYDNPNNIFLEFKNSFYAPFSFHSNKQNSFKVNPQVFDEKVIAPILNSIDSCEKDLLSINSEYIDRTILDNYRKLSVAHFVVSTIEQLIIDDPGNSNKYCNIILAGGVLNTPNLVDVLKHEILSLMKGGKQASTKLIKFYVNDGDNRFSFSKGANYLCKLCNLEDIMISKQDYYNNGVENLSFMYI